MISDNDSLAPFTAVVKVAGGKALSICGLFIVKVDPFQNLFLAFDIHLGINGGQMFFDSGNTDKKRGGNLFIGIPVQDQIQYIFFASGQGEILGDLCQSAVHHVG